MTTVGVLLAPPLRLTTAMVRGPGQCWLTVRMSSRSESSSSEGSIRMPRRVSAPRQPWVAGSRTGALTRKDVSFKLRRVGASSAAASGCSGAATADPLCSAGAGGHGWSSAAAAAPEREPPAPLRAPAPQRGRC